MAETVCPPPGAFLAAIELDGSQEDVLFTLASAAYHGCRLGIVVLVLREVSAAKVDRILDPVVRREGLDVHGVFYVDARDQATVAQVVRRSSCVIAVTDDFCESLRRIGVDAVRWDERACRLDQWLLPSPLPHLTPASKRSFSQTPSRAS